MDLDTDDDVLRALSEGKSMDYEQWPSLLARLIPRLEKIVQNDFPFPIPPILPSQPNSSSPPTQETTANPSSQDSTTSTNKENAAPTTLTRFPPQIQTFMNSITSTLNTLFTTHPPHTIQRLAELLLNPTQHYRTLPSYLHALDRVVHVTSGAHVFPLPPAIPDPSSLTVLSNGTPLTGRLNPLSISWGNPASNPSASSLGSDESLGGALLTPITWLNKNGAGSTGTQSPLEGEVKTESTEMIEGPNGPGGIETVSVSINGVPSTTSPTSTTSSDPTNLAASLRAGGGITQGELLRQEQRAGVVPAAQLIGNKGDSDGLGEEDELPHARGPEEIGMEDMGPQGASGSDRGGPLGAGMQGIDIEAAVGRRLAPKTTTDNDDKEGEFKIDVDDVIAGHKAEEEGEGKKETEAPTTPKREAEEDLGGEGKKFKPDPEAESESEPKPRTEDTDVEIVDADGQAKTEEGADTVDTTAV